MTQRKSTGRGRKSPAKSTAKAIEKVGVVEIRMKNPKRTGTVTIRDYTDPETGELRELKNSHGNKRVVKYNRAVRRLDLSKPNDELEYKHVLDHPIFVKGPSPILEVVDIVAQAEQDVRLKDLEAEVNYQVRSLGGTALRSFARVLGIPINTNSDDVIKRALYDMVEEDPELVKDEYDHPDRTLKEMLYDGKQNGVFKVKSGIWYFNEAQMGTNFDQALLWLKDNEDLQPNIRTSIGS